MSKTWGAVGAWAADAERAEAEEKERAASGSAEPPGSFPSLKEATAAASSSKSKKKKMTLSEFTTGNYVGPGGATKRDFSTETKGLTPDEMLRLPTGPKERSAEEMEQGRLGGGFRSYGRSGPLRDSDGGGRRSYGGFDDERRGGPPPARVSDFDQPSRADEVDNWALGKKPAHFGSTDSRRSERYAALGSGGGAGGGSRADEVDNWGIGKKPVNVPAPGTRSAGFGSGFRESERWSKGESFDDGGRERGGSFDDGGRERPRLVLDPPRGDGGASGSDLGRNRASPFGAARPREEVLAEKGLDWKKMDMESENVQKMSRPTSSQSSRPSSAQSSRNESPKARQKVNPFGDAKPREILLQEQGKDWRKIDLDLERRGVDRPETDEEKMLKEEISLLKEELVKEAEVSVNGEPAEGSLTVEQTSLQNQILHKERELELLIRELDDKVRFGQRGSERPSSGAGRVTGLSDRPPSRSGMSEESRSTEFMEGPWSRGGEAWTKSGDDRRVFNSSRERGFLGNKGLDRSKSRERW